MDGVEDEDEDEQYMHNDYGVEDEEDDEDGVMESG